MAHFTITISGANLDLLLLPGPSQVLLYRLAFGCVGPDGSRPDGWPRLRSMTLLRTDVLLSTKAPLRPEIAAMVTRMFAECGHDVEITQRVDRLGPALEHLQFLQYEDGEENLARLAEMSDEERALVEALRPALTPRVEH